MKTGLVRTIVIAFFFVFVSLSVCFSTSPAASPSNPEAVETKYCRARLLDDGVYFKALTEAIDGARSEIVMSYFLFKTNGYKSSLPDRVLNRLTAAVQRGVTVRVILEREANQNSTLNRNNRETAERLRRGNIEVRFDSPETTTHTKVAIIDRRYVFIGSHNLTSSALRYNHELSLLVDSPEMAREALDYVNDLER